MLVGEEKEGWVIIIINMGEQQQQQRQQWQQVLIEMKVSPIPMVEGEEQLLVEEEEEVKVMEEGEKYYHLDKHLQNWNYSINNIYKINVLLLLLLQMPLLLLLLHQQIIHRVH